MNGMVVGFTDGQEGRRTDGRTQRARMATRLTDLDHNTDQCTGYGEQNHVLYEPGEPEGAISGTHGPQDLLQSGLLLQHQALDGLTHCVHEGQHQEHGQDAPNAVDEAGYGGGKEEEVKMKEMDGWMDGGWMDE